MRIKILIQTATFLAPLCLVGCNVVGNTATTPAVATKDKNIAQEKYIRLLDLLNALNQTLEEVFSMPRPYTMEDGFEYLRPVITEAHNSQKELLELLEQKTQQLIQGEINVNDYLEFLLVVRLGYLQSRNKNVENYILGKQQNYHYVIPADKQLFDWLEESLNKSEACQEYDEFIRLKTVERYEIITLLIRESFSMCNLDELNDYTIKLLKSSIQLHPILEGSRHDLGHPDEVCGGYYGLMKQVLFSSKSQDFKKCKELQEIRNKTEDLVIPVEERGRDIGWVYRKKFLWNFIALVDQQKKVNKALNKELMKLTEQQDYSIYKAHFNESPRSRAAGYLKTILTDFGTTPYMLTYRFLGYARSF